MPRSGCRRKRQPELSLPGLTRQSVAFARILLAMTMMPGSSPGMTTVGPSPNIMAIRFDDIGNRHSAGRLGSGLSADEIANRLGISRTALYRFEKGELAKIETLERLAELLGVSIPTLLGVGIEYIPSAGTYFERMRQIEETSEHLMVLSCSIWFLLASDNFQVSLEEVLTENVTKSVANRERALSDIPKIMDILRARKAAYRRRQPTIVNLMSAMEIERFLHHGLIGRSGLPEDVVFQRKALARAEIEHFIELLEKP